MEVGDFRIEAMAGGLTNRVYKLCGVDASYVLRLNADHTEAFGLDRHREISILEQASAAGLAPQIVHADVANGILLLHYIEGRAWTSDDLVSFKNLELLASLLRSVHALPLSGKKFDASAIADAYLGNLSAQPELHTIGVRCKALIDCVELSESWCFCHNDVVAANVIARPDLMLLDWEYACDNDPLFDLASLISYHGLDKTIADILLNAYAGGIDAGLRDRLNERVHLYAALHWLWLASREVHSPDRNQANRLVELELMLR
jgi:thiamine kinase